MAEWCAANLRNCEGWKSAKLELSTTCDENAKWLDACIRQLVSWSDCISLGGFHNSLTNLCNSDPDAIMARAFLVGLAGLGTESAGRDKEFCEKMRNLEIDAEKMGNPREKRHAKAAILWGRGKHHEAAAEWDAILDEHPTDLIAVKFSHDAHFFNGSQAGKLNAIRKVIGKWSRDAPCYSYLHGMLAFGLEESAKYEEAEKEADTALALNRFDCWASHAKAHVFEMNGKIAEGIRFMYDTENHWKQGWMLASHNYWHTALFHIEFGEYEDALAIFDREISHRFNRTNSLLDMVDASSLLCRLELEGVHVGVDRWRAIENLGRFIDNHSIVFNDVHLGVALFKQGELEVENKLHDSLRNYTEILEEDNARISKTIGIPLYEGMLNFAKGNYDEAVRQMYPIRDQVVNIGGSHAQRDLFSQTLIQSCILSQQQEHWKLAPQVLMERNSLKRNSLLGQRLVDKFRNLHPINT